MGAEAKTKEKEKVHHYLASYRWATMKYFLLLVIATVAFAAPAEQDIDEEFDEFEGPDKRNSELKFTLSRSRRYSSCWQEKLRASQLIIGSSRRHPQSRKEKL